MALTMTGCDPKEDIHDRTPNEYNSRMDVNRQYIGILQDNGVIDPSTAGSLLEHFKDWAELEKVLLNGKDTKGNRLKTMIAKIYKDDKGNPVAKSDTFKNFLKGLGTDTSCPWGLGSGEALELFKMNKVSVYTAKYISGADGIDTLKKAVDAIQKKYKECESISDEEKNKAKKDEKNEELNALINKYFNNTGKSLFPDEIPLLRLTEKNENKKNEFGKDFIVYEKDPDSKKDRAIMTIRMLEINPHYVDLVTNSSSYNNSGGKYVLVGDKALLVAYPVSYLKAIKQNGDKFEFVREQSNLLLNIVSGGLSKFELTSDKKIDTATGIENYSNKLLFADETDINILLGKASDDEVKSITTEKFMENGKESTKVLETVTKAAKNGKGYKMDSSKLFSTDKMSNASFMMLPSSKKDVTYVESVKDPNDSSKKIQCEFTVSCNEIVLKDYLECVPTPGYHDSGYTPLGRRIRFRSEVIENGGAETDTWAMYIDNSGSNMFPLSANTALTSMPITLNDIVSTDSNANLVQKLKKDAAGEKVAGTGDENSKAKMLGDPGAEIEYLQEMNISFRFPGVMRASSDANLKDSKQLMYAVKINKDIFETSLYSSWLTSDDKYNSTGWWNDWLSANGFSFKVDIKKLLGDVKDAESYEREQKEVIKLDLNVIGSIQDDIDDENTMDMLAMIRTIFFIIGIILLFYGLLIPCSWLFDTNVPMGPKVLTLLTFGRWVAVPEKDEFCTDSENVNYVDLKDVIIGGILVIGLGILLTSFDMVKLIATIIGAMGNTAKWLWNLIFR